jgi:hypothetical protein
LKSKKIELWNILWIEWIYAMFLRTFDLKTCMLLWDFILIKGDQFVFKLSFVIFGFINENFEEIDKNKLFDDIRKLIILKADEIVESVCNQNKHEFDFIFIEKLLKKSLLF